MQDMIADMKDVFKVVEDFGILDRIKTVEYKDGKSVRVEFTDYKPEMIRELLQQIAAEYA